MRGAVFFPQAAEPACPPSPLAHTTHLKQASRTPRARPRKVTSQGRWSNSPPQDHQASTRTQAIHPHPASSPLVPHRTTSQHQARCSANSHQATQVVRSKVCTRLRHRLGSSVWQDKGQCLCSLCQADTRHTLGQAPTLVTQDSYNVGHHRKGCILVAPCTVLGHYRQDTRGQGTHQVCNNSRVWGRVCKCRGRGCPGRLAQGRSARRRRQQCRGTRRRLRSRGCLNRGQRQRQHASDGVRHQVCILSLLAQRQVSARWTLTHATVGSHVRKGRLRVLMCVYVCGHVIGCRC